MARHLRTLLVLVVACAAGCGDGDGERAAEPPVAETPAAETPAAEMPAADMPAADMPAADMPAADMIDPSPLPAVDLPPGFGHIRGSTPTMFAGADDSLYMVFQWKSNTIEVLDDPALLAQLFESEGFRAEATAEPARRRRDGVDVRELTYRLRAEDGVVSGAHVAAFHCDRRDVTYMIVYFGDPDLDATAARSYTDRVRCPDRPVLPETLPEAGEVIGGLCAGGDDTACSVLRDLAAQGLVDAPPPD